MDMRIMIADYRQHLKQVMTIHTETVRRLVNNDSTPPLEMAAVLEDIANLYLDMSDEIRNAALGRTEVELLSDEEILEERIPAVARG